MYNNTHMAIFFFTWRGGGGVYCKSQVMAYLSMYLSISCVWFIWLYCQKIYQFHICISYIKIKIIKFLLWSVKWNGQPLCQGNCEILMISNWNSGGNSLISNENSNATFYRYVDVVKCWLYQYNKYHIKQWIRKIL